MRHFMSNLRQWFHSFTRWTTFYEKIKILNARTKPCLKSFSLEASTTPIQPATRPELALVRPVWNHVGLPSSLLCSNSDFFCYSTMSSTSNQTDIQTSSPPSVQLPMVNGIRSPPPLSSEHSSHSQSLPPLVLCIVYLLYYPKNCWRASDTCLVGRQGHTAKKNT